MKALRKQYTLDQSPFYKLRSHKRLAKILGVSLKSLHRIAQRGDKNYWYGEVGPEKRKIEVPKSQLGRLHSRINKLLSRIDPPAYLSSGVRGRSHITNAAHHRGELSVLKLDIKQYYQSTSRQIIENGFVSRFRMPRDIASTLASICVAEGHIPTGSPLSQSLSFHVNFSVFERIYELAQSQGINFSLYVDDLTFSGESISSKFCGEVTSFLMRTRGYKCHKIRRYKPSTDKVITGVVVRGDRLLVMNRHRKIISDLMKRESYNSSLGRHSAPPKAIKFFQSYIGHLYSAGQINPRYKQHGARVVELRRSLGIPSQNQHSAT